MPFQFSSLYFAVDKLSSLIHTLCDSHVQHITQQQAFFIYGSQVQLAIIMLAPILTSRSLVATFYVYANSLELAVLFNHSSWVGNMKLQPRHLLTLVLFQELHGTNQAVKSREPQNYYIVVKFRSITTMSPHPKLTTICML